MARVEVGQRYAYREPSDTWPEPLLPVEVIKLGPMPRSEKVRIRWLEALQTALVATKCELRLRLVRA